MKTFFINIYLFFYRLTPKGKAEHILECGIQGMQISSDKQTLSKVNAVVTAKKVQSTEKIIAFNKGKSVRKPKKTTHETLKLVKKEHAADLAANNLKLSEKGKFQDA